MTQPDNSDSDRLPGEIDEETMEVAQRAVMFKLIGEALPNIEDDSLAHLLAMYHEEWERRHGERWGLVDDATE